MSKRKKNKTQSEENLNQDGLESVLAINGEEHNISDDNLSELDAVSLAEQIAAELGGDGVEVDSSLFVSEELQAEGLLPEAAEEESLNLEEDATSESVELEGTELDSFESAEIEELEFVEDERIESIVESILFASDRPVSLNSIKMVFQGTNVKTDKIRRVLDNLAVEYAGGRRGVTLEEVPGGYQLRSKIDNMEFLRRTLKSKPFKLSGPALEVLAIVAYKQPIIKHEIDEIRGVESGHLLRALMEKALVNFEGKSDLPGRPMQYGTTRKFLEIFGLRSLKELPTLSQIDELLPEGIGDEEEKDKQSLSDITSSMSEALVSSYSQGEEELEKIQSQLEEISTSTQFFEEEKRREKIKQQQEKAQSIREAILVGEKVATRDMNWLTRYDEAIAAGHALLEQEWPFQKKKTQATNPSAEQSSNEGSDASIAGANIEDASSEVELAEDNISEEMIEAFDNDTDDAHSADELPFYGEADEIDEENQSEELNHKLDEEDKDAEV